MRFISSITAVLATASLSVAAPVDQKGAIAARADDADTYWTISHFKVEWYAHIGSATYSFAVMPHSPNKNRLFNGGVCTMELEANSLVGVASAQCDVPREVYLWPELTFSLGGFDDNDGEFAGIILSMTHPWHDNHAGLHYDFAGRRFHKDLVKTKGEGKKLRHYLDVPSSFNVSVTSACDSC